MAMFWMTEALPINVTALLPVFLFPLLGVISADTVAKTFFTVRLTILNVCFTVCMYYVYRRIFDGDVAKWLARPTSNQLAGLSSNFIKGSRCFLKQTSVYTQYLVDSNTTYLSMTFLLELVCFAI